MANNYFVGWMGGVNSNKTSLWLPGLVQDAYMFPYIGMPTQVAVFNEFGDVMLTTRGAATEYAGLCDAYEWLSKYFRQFEFTEAVSDPKACFFGFNVKQLLFSLEVWARQQGLSSDCPATRMWFNPPGVFDINDILIPGPMRSEFDCGSLLQYFDAQIKNSRFYGDISQFVGPGRCDMQTADDKAKVAYTLGCCVGLASW